MALKPVPRPCKKCKRPTTNANQYCDEHQSFYVPSSKLYDHRRGSPSKRGYDGTWKKFREVFLMEHPLCERCLREGRVAMANEVHHKVPLCEGGARLDPDNCAALCHSCHSKITSEWINERNNDLGRFASKQDVRTDTDVPPLVEGISDDGGF